MKRNTLEYFFLILSGSVLLLSIWFTVRAFSENNPKLAVEKLERKLLFMETETEILKKEVTFEIKPGQTVYVEFKKGALIEKMLHSGTISLGDEQGNIRLSVDILKDENFHQQILLEAGKYSWQEEISVNWEEIRKEESKERKDSGFWVDENEYFVQALIF